MQPVKVVAHYLDGKLLKGYIQGFNENAPFFYVLMDTVPGSQSVLVKMNEIKALFFVKSMDGNREYQERKQFDDSDQAMGRRAEVVFKDGEVLQGIAAGYDRNRVGCYLIPVDPNSNNSRIFVVMNSVKDFNILPVVPVRAGALGK
jgi:hypothetical protein